MFWRDGTTFHVRTKGVFQKCPICFGRERGAQEDAALTFGYRRPDPRFGEGGRAVPSLHRDVYGHPCANAWGILTRLLTFCGKR
jgi:hypothetical protein